MSRKEADLLERADVAFVEALVEALDLITSDRSYRKGSSFDQVCDEIAALSRKQFDPQTVQIFLRKKSHCAGRWKESACGRATHPPCRT